MNLFRADLHIHTVLSPCGDLNMSPGNIINEAKRKKLDIIGLTDHNSVRHCKIVRKMAEEAGILALMGAEVTTTEEVHCLVFFEKTETIDEFGEFLNDRLPDVRNVPSLFGYQVQVNEKEEIIYTEEKMLLNAVNISIDDLGEYVHKRMGLFIPAHIDRKKNSIYSQLGILPPELNADALELSALCNHERFLNEHPELLLHTIIKGSDAHFTGQIGMSGFLIEAERASFSEVIMALKGINGRKVLQL